MTMTQSHHVIFHVDFTLNSIDLIKKKAKKKKFKAIVLDTKELKSIYIPN